jgi:hypothetical protein
LTLLLDGSGHDISELDRLTIEVDLSARDPRDVQQVVHQASQVSDLPIDHRQLAELSALEPHQLHRGRDRGERVAQFVSEHREEFILRTIGRLGGSVRASQSRGLLLDSPSREHLLRHVDIKGHHPFDFAALVANRQVGRVPAPSRSRQVARAGRSLLII